MYIDNMPNGYARVVQSHLILKHLIHLAFGHLALLLFELLRQVHLDFLATDHLVVVSINHLEDILRRRGVVDGQQFHVKM